MTIKKYQNAAAFKNGLEQRLRTLSSGFDLTRRRQLLVFDRFLARISLELSDTLTLKGGLAVELRIERARTTKDIDVRVMGFSGDIIDRLRAAAAIDLGDFMNFTVNPDNRHPEIQGDGVQYDGKRYRVECRLAGKMFGSPFGLDVAFGDPILGEPDIFTADDTLSFAGIAPPTLRVYPLETHIAEKLHAYTMPRLHQNSRVKDLPDLAILAGIRHIDSVQIITAINQTFTFRNTHAVPVLIPQPPLSWDAPYAAIAKDDRLQWLTLADVFIAAQSFLDPVLSGHRQGTWDPQTWSWV